MSQLSDILNGGSASGDNHSSVVARLGQLGQKYTDPLAWIFGRKYTDKLVDIADFSNQQFSSVMKPFDKVDQTINPFRRYNVIPAANNLKDWVAEKPADAGAIAAGAYFGAGALGGGLGGGGSGAGTSGGLGTGPAGAGLGTGGVGAADALPSVTVTGSTGGLGAPAYFAGGAGAGTAGANSNLTDHTSSDSWNRAFSNRTDFSTGLPSSGENPAAGIGGINGPVGGGTGASPAADMSTSDYAKLGMNLLGSGNQQQGQQQPMMYIDRSRPAQTPTTAPTADPAANQRTSGGLGRVGSALFPVDPQLAQVLGPAYVQQAQNNALLKLGLGMVAAGRQPGGTFGGALASGLGNASTDLNGAMQTAYQNARAARADKRADESADRQTQREDRLDKRQQYLEDHQLQREKVLDTRAADEQQFREDQAIQAQKRWEAQQRQEAQGLAMRGIPPGYRYNLQGNLEFIPGGPADPSVASGNKTLRPIPAPAAKGLIENRTSIAKIDNALAALDKNPDAFGLQNYLPDAVTQRMSGNAYQGGVDARGKVGDIGSLIIHDRSGAAVTAAEMPRLKPFIPQSTDDPKTVKTKLENLKANLQLMQDEIEGFYTPEMGYRPLSQPGAPAAGPVIPAPLQRGLGAPPPQANPGNVAQRAASYY